jgi:hypothetical protein
MDLCYGNLGIISNNVFIIWTGGDKMENKDNKKEVDDMQAPTKEENKSQIQDDLKKVEEAYGVFEKYVDQLKNVSIDEAIRLGKERYLKEKMKKISGE